MNSEQMRLLEDQLNSKQAKADQLLVDARTAAAMCGKSPRTWRTWDALGLIPRPVRIKHSTLWSVDELRAWIKEGCPRRNEWEAARK
jgi:predicted DNA-binding transcriptional regulator AlpA